MDWLYYVCLFVVIAILRPALWGIVISMSLAISHTFMSDKYGKLFFGHYWHPRKQRCIPSPENSGASGWVK